MSAVAVKSVLDAVHQVRAALHGVRHEEPAEAAPIVYRLLFLRLVEARGAVVGARTPGVPGLPPALLGEVGQSLVLDGLDAAGELPVALGRLHELVLEAAHPDERKSRGSYYTPPRLVDHLLDHVLEPALDEAEDPAAVTVLDPSCGPGLFLVNAARRIARRGVPMKQALRQVHGIDLDHGAVELARICLWLEQVLPGEPPEPPPLHLRVDDALLGCPPPVQYDVVVGNPPFLNQLERRTSTGPAVARLLQEQSGGALRPYTDRSAVFLHRAVGWAKDGGRIALVQPLSLLAARDAAGVRRHVAQSCSLDHLWASETTVFDAQVLTCAPVLRKGVPQGPVSRSHGPTFEAVASRERPTLTGEWSFLLAAGLGIPELRLDPAGTVGELASCTADFRDQYYGLAPYVREAADCPDGVPLVTTGLIEPAECLWGRASTRFLKRRWDAPVIDLRAVEDERLARWAESRLVPKLLVGTQGKVVEAVVDEHGRWLPSVPTLTVVPPADRLWHLLAVLLAPPVAAHAAATYAGTALSMRRIKLSARQVAALPLPRDRAAWDEGAEWARAAQHDDVRREEHLLRLGSLMCAAYGTGEELLGWWAERAGLIRLTR